MTKLKIHNESKEAKFKRIAETRANKILNQLSVLRNCANPRIYSYNDHQVNIIFKAVEEELKITKMAFFGNKKRNKGIRL
ncbi:MAG: hypothetical protein Q7R96_03360 [Nanoarchaeota archaeon]|nr:hypothetical protein [Nanoarchaeota archaeon]